jgi:hypothetical protein
MKLGQTGLFMESLEYTRRVKTLEGGTYEPPLTNLKTDRSDLRNLDRNHLFLFSISSHLVVVF